MAEAHPPGAPWPARHNALRGRAGRPLRAAAGAPATRARRPPGSGCAGPAPAPRCYPATGRSLPGAAGCPGDNATGRRRRTGKSARPRHGPAAPPPPVRARPARLRDACDTAACSAKPGPAAPPALPANPRAYRRSRRTRRRDGLRGPAPRWRNRAPEQRQEKRRGSSGARGEPFAAGPRGLPRQVASGAQRETERWLGKSLECHRTPFPARNFSCSCRLYADQFRKNYRNILQSVVLPGSRQTAPTHSGAPYNGGLLPLNALSPQVAQWTSTQSI